MKTRSWAIIIQTYEEILLNLTPIRDHRTKGIHHILNLIPLLRQSEILKGGIHYTSHYNLVFEVPEKKAQVRILPPGPILSGSSTEFQVILSNPESSHIVSERSISASLLEEVVQMAEDYFIQLKNDKNIW